MADRGGEISWDSTIEEPTYERFDTNVGICVQNMQSVRAQHKYAYLRYLLIRILTETDLPKVGITTASWRIFTVYRTVT